MRAFLRALVIAGVAFSAWFGWLNRQNPSSGTRLRVGSIAGLETGGVALPEALRVERLAIPPSHETAPVVSQQSELELEKEERAQDLAALLCQLDAELRLGAERLEVIQQILLDRRDQVEAFHAQILRGGVLSLKEYHWMARQVMGRSDDRIRSVMTRLQAERFTDLRSNNLLLDGIGLKIEPGITVTD